MRSITNRRPLIQDKPAAFEVQEYPLEEANKALLDLKNKHIRGAKVLRIGRD